MKKVAFFCLWNQTPLQLLNRYKKMTENNLGIYKDLQGTDNILEADIIVFMEGIPKNLNLNYLKNKTLICFPREPYGKKNWEQLNLPHGYTYDNIFHVITDTEHMRKDYDFLKKLEYHEHPKTLSAVVSSKNDNAGYHLRVRFFIRLSQVYPDLCDIYGAGWKDELGRAYKGELDAYRGPDKKHDNRTKFDALYEYKYSISIENCSKKNYFTEKLTDPMLSWCIPIYYGCSNVHEYFPEHSYYWLDITKGDCLEKLKEIISRPITQVNIDALIKARELIFTKYNMWDVVLDKTKDLSNITS